MFLTYFDFVIFAVSYWWPTGLALQFLLQVLKWEAWTSEILLVQRQELEETYTVQHQNLAKIGNHYKIRIDNSLFIGFVTHLPDPAEDP